MTHNLITRLVKEHAISATLYVNHESYRFLLGRRWDRELNYTVKSLPFYLKKVKNIFLLESLVHRHFVTHEQRKNQYDLWHAVFAYPSGAIISHLEGIPKVLRCPGSDIQVSGAVGYGIRRDPSMNRKVIRVLKKMDALIAMSETIREEYIDAAPVEDSIRLIPNGVDAVRLRLQKEKAELKRKLDIPTDKKVILTVGRNHPKKGFDSIPEMTKSLLRSRDDFLWIMIGKGAKELARHSLYPEVSTHLKLLDQIGIDDNRESLSHIGEVPSIDLVRYYNAADVFAFPSLLESFGIVLIEAMAAGLPIVTTDAPGCRDLVKPGYNGVQAPAGDTESFVRGILDVLENASLRELFIRNGLKEVREEYDWPVVAAKHMALYERLCERVTAAKTS